MNKQDVRRRIQEVGIIPSIRVSSMEDALFAAEAISRGGIPILEVTLTVPEATKVISHLVQRLPEVIVGAGSVLDAETAHRCLDAGAVFLTSDGLDPETVKFAVQANVVVIPGTLTPTDVIAAWKLDPDFVKVVPCGQFGGESYIRALKAMFPKVPLIAAGGVNQRTAFNFIAAGAVALGIGSDLIPREAVRNRQPLQIAELARRLMNSVSSARGQ
ncbi:MAG TPA: bifunctional 4-hydroxy-2-oxoglutarate aldolase/2-dehydro-3-deoxy-phosphogluconate aldolase [Terriglobales bacterium]|nr:bifunctional 4-hydroxy-2-oxoglutarate aldolase/2-dehydro-3-deoxy-phosphogluconate aldolase [Terriglobales bacterium]